MSIEAFVRIREKGKKDNLEPLSIGPSFEIVGPSWTGGWVVQAKPEWVAERMEDGARSVSRANLTVCLGFLLIGYGVGALLTWMVMK